MKIRNLILTTLMLSVIWAPGSMYYELTGTQMKEANSILKYDGEEAAVKYINIHTKES